MPENTIASAVNTRIRLYIFDSPRSYSRLDSISQVQSYTGEYH